MTWRGALEKNICQKMISDGISEKVYFINASSMGKIMRYLFSYLKLNHFSCFKNYHNKCWFLLFDCATIAFSIGKFIAICFYI
jgi:hypothetical protein